MNIHWQEVIGTAAVWSALSYAVETFPCPNNAYARWLVGILQFLFANKAKAKEAFKKEGE